MIYKEIGRYLPTIEYLVQEVEYDMDEEDVAWLKLMNEKRKSKLNSESCFGTYGTAFLFILIQIQYF